MLKFIGKALAGLVLTKEAQEAVGQIAVAKVAPILSAAPRPVPAAVREPTAEPAGIAPVSAAPAFAGVMTADRAELIRQALRVRAAKQTLLADLDDESRAKLVAMAITAFGTDGRSKA